MSHSLYAQSGNDELEELDLSYGDAAFISIATGRSKPINKAPAVATIITAQQIQEIGARTIDEVLESVPGLHVSDSSTRLSPIYSIRGIHTDRNPQVLMLLNGIPMTQLYFGDRGFASSMPVNAISRIEIIRGPGSAIYGADAFAGVINVITKSADDYDGSEAGVRIGDFGTRDLWVSNGMEHENGLKTAFSLQYLSTDGDDDRIIESDAQSLFDEFFSTNASFAPGAMDTQQERIDINFEILKDKWSFRYWSRHVSDLGGGPGIALALDPEGTGEINDYLIDFTLQNPLGLNSWSTKLNISYYDVNGESESVLFPAGTVLPIDVNGNVNPLAPVNTPLFPEGLIGNPSVFEERSSIEIIALSEDFENHNVRLAAGVSHSKLEPEEQKNYGLGPGEPVGILTDVTGTDLIFVRTESRDVYYISVQDEINIASDWELTAGVRYDDYSDFGSTTNPRLSLVWDTLNNLTTKFLFGRAFRAPSFAELYAINNPVIQGNEDLDPEVITTFEVAFDYSPGLTHHAGLSIYTYDIEDLIQFVPDGTGPSIAQNTGKQSGQGIEFEWVWNPQDDLSLSGNIALAKATDEETDSGVANFPEKQLYLKARWQFLPGWQLVPELHHVADRNRAEDDPRDSIDDNTLMNVALNSTSKDSNIKWTIGVKNLTNEDIAEPSPIEAGTFVPGDFPRPGRMYYVTGQVKF
jgi:iron complex outermembrane receptor protein